MYICSPWKFNANLPRWVSKVFFDCLWSHCLRVSSISCLVKRATVWDADIRAPNSGEQKLGYNAEVRCDAIDITLGFSSRTACSDGDTGRVHWLTKKYPQGASSSIKSLGVICQQRRIPRQSSIACAYLRPIPLLRSRGSGTF